MVRVKVADPGELGELVDPGDPVSIRGSAAKDRRMRVWAANKDGYLSGEMDLEFA